MTQRAALYMSLLLAAGLLLNHRSTAQTFQRTYGGDGLDEGRHVLVLEDGGFLITGRTTSDGSGTEGLWVMRTNGEGEVLWSRTYGGQFSEVGQRARVHPEGGFVVLGHTDNSWGGLRNLYLLRIAGDGTLLWSRSIGSSGNDDASDIQVLPDGGYLLTGNSGTFGSRRLLVVKLNANGDILWVRQPGGGSNDNGRSLALAPDGGFVVVGSTDGFGASATDWLVMRFDPNGELLWTRTYGLGGNSVQRALSVLPAADGGWLIGGTTDGGTSDQNILVLRVDDAGEFFFDLHLYGDLRQDLLRSITPAHGDGYVLCGHLFDTPGQAQDHALLMHVGPEGEVLWSRTYGEEGEVAEFYDVARTPTGYVMTGQRTDADGNVDLLLVCTDTNGQSGCDQAEVTMDVSGLSLVVNQPTPTSSALGISASTPPTAFNAGPNELDIACLNGATGLRTNATSTVLHTYPNPAHERLWIDMDRSNPALRLFDARGVLALEAPVVNGALDVRTLAPGLYTGILNGPDGPCRNRFVKE